MYKNNFIKIVGMSLVLIASNVIASFGMSDFAEIVLRKERLLKDVLEIEASILDKNGLGCCGCPSAPRDQHKVLFERMAQDLEKKYPNKKQEIVVTNFAEGGGFDPGLAVYTLLYCGYRTITINAVGTDPCICGALQTLARLIKQDLGQNTKIIEKKNILEIHNDDDEKITIILVGIEDGFGEYAAGIRNGTYQKSHVYTNIDISSCITHLGNELNFPIPLQQKQLDHDSSITQKLNTIALVSNAFKDQFEYGMIMTNKVPHHVCIRIARNWPVHVCFYKQVAKYNGDETWFNCEPVSNTSDIVDFEKIYGSLIKDIQALVIELEKSFKSCGSIYKNISKNDVINRMFAMAKKYKFSFLASRNGVYSALEDFRDCVAFTKVDNDPLIYELNDGTVEKHEKEFSFPE